MIRQAVRRALGVIKNLQVTEALVTKRIKMEPAKEVPTSPKSGVTGTVREAPEKSLDVTKSSDYNNILSESTENKETKAEDTQKNDNGENRTVDVDSGQSEPQGIKRLQNDEGSDLSSVTKKLKTNETSEGQQEQLGTRCSRNLPYKKKKVAMLMIYSGKGYLGMQKNTGFKTIEADLFGALVKAGVVTEDHASDPGSKMGFQRAARTDKGVSAAGQVVSLKMFIDVENAIEKINSHLTDQIRVLGTKRTTKGFNSKNNCSHRTYSYMLPTFSFAPVEEIVTDDYRVTSDILQRVNEILLMYKGTHNFHNFTSGKKPDDRSSHRYIIDMNCGSPFIQRDMEFAVITVQGQSFMMHQIRKMVGLMIAIVRGLTGVEAIERAWEPEKADVPKAPGLGLMLEKIHYDAYNNRYGKDGLHEAIEWDEYKDVIDKFKGEFIYETMIETEKTEKSMLQWLSTLHLHHFEKKITNFPIRAETGVGTAHFRVDQERKEKAKAAADSKANGSGGEAEENTSE